MLEVKGLTKAFGKHVAVDNISFDIGKGDIRGLIGPNGSGKTTIFNMISGFLPPSKGQILLEDRQIQGLRPHRIAASGLVRTFQLTSLYRELTVLENVELGHHLRSGRKARNPVTSVRDNALLLLDLFELTSLRDVPARLLPGGTQRVLSIATAAAADPMLLLLDEPLAGLNPTEKANVVEKIRGLRDRGMTVFIVEHDVKSVLSLCNRIVVINFGKRIFDGASEDVASDDRVIEAYLGKASEHA